MRLNVLLMILLAPLIQSCSSIQRPSGTLWTLVPKEQKALGVPYNLKDIPDQETQTQGLDLMESYICFSPSDFESVEYYMSQLRNHQCE